MSLTKLDIDRYITTLRTNSKEFNNISDVQLSSMLENVISNINEVAYFWSTVCSDNKGTTKTPAEGEEWLGGPFAAVLATQYYIETLQSNDDLSLNSFGFVFTASLCQGYGSSDHLFFILPTILPKDILSN